MMNRREALGLMAASGALCDVVAAAALPGHISEPALPTVVKGPRINRVQAEKILTELELDALVLGTGRNFRYASGMRPVSTRMGFPASAFAIVSRQPAVDVTIVAPSFTYYYQLADVQETDALPAFVYGPMTDPELASESTAPAALTVFNDRGEMPVDAIESHRVQTLTAAIEAHGRYPSLEQALGAALNSLDIRRGRVAIDHPRVTAALTKAESRLETVDADDALRRIRPVKSANEISLMRNAAAGNVRAAHEALQIVRSGGSYHELRAEFYAAAARRGQRGVFMVIDRSSDEQFNAEFRDGQAFLIDCVSEYEGYHGDYGRTIFVGEPAKSMQRATRAMADAWDNVRGRLRPGLKFSEIESLGQQSLKVAGKSYRIPFRPHSVGLFHTDHVGYSGLPFPADVTLEPGMVISVDCPLLESGVGGSAHLEDLMLITADGSEPLHPTNRQVITV